MAQLLEWLADASCFGLFLYKWIIIAAVIMTWVSADPHNSIVQWIARVSRPLWVWCESWMPVMMSHFSAYASILVVIFAQIVLPAEIRSLNLLVHGLIDVQGFLLQSGGHLLQGTSIVVQSLMFFCIFILIAWFVLTLVNPSLSNPLVRIIHVLADPLITPLQRYLPRTRIDWSPLVGMLLFYLISSSIVSPVGYYGSTLSFPVSICVY
ncbi:MAG: hypothetical protein MAG581_00883 [Deltaproteobacteria bacterium]|jgi:YggT family protein|nr:hypothetical protein [Deltaproteobacteria bacterium]